LDVLVSRGRRGCCIASVRWLRRGQSGSYLARYGPFPAPSLPDSSVKPIRFTSGMILAPQTVLRSFGLGLDEDEARWTLAPRRLLAAAVFKFQRVFAWAGAIMVECLYWPQINARDKNGCISHAFNFPWLSLMSPMTYSRSFECNKYNRVTSPLHYALPKAAKLQIRIGKIVGPPVYERVFLAKPQSKLTVCTGRCGRARR
jgi:hypothetical protein